MDGLFTNITSNYYTRQYAVNPELVHGHRLTMYAVCDLNPSNMNGDFYGLSLFFSVDDYRDRQHIITVSFRQSQMKRSEIDAEIDSWIKQNLDDNIHERIHNYLKEIEVWEQYQ